MKTTKLFWLKAFIITLFLISVIRFSIAYTKAHYKNKDNRQLSEMADYHESEGRETKIVDGLLIVQK